MLEGGGVEDDLRVALGEDCRDAFGVAQVGEVQLRAGGRGARVSGCCSFTRESIRSSGVT